MFRNACPDELDRGARSWIFFQDPCFTSEAVYTHQTWNLFAGLLDIARDDSESIGAAFRGRGRSSDQRACGQEQEGQECLHEQGLHVYPFNQATCTGTDRYS